MNFVKWSLYLLAFSAFVWFIFFKPLNTDADTKLLADTETNISDDAIGEYEPDRTIEDAEFADNDEITSESTTDYVEQEVVEPEEEEVITETPVNNGSININSKYLIVVGSFGVRSNADRMLKRVKNSGKDGVITNIRGLNRVVTASTDDQNDAQRLRDHFTHIYKEQAFILEQ